MATTTTRRDRRVARRASTGIALGTAVALGLGACQPVVVLTPAPPKRPAGEAIHVDVIGDSLIRQATPAISSRLTAAGFPNTIASELAVDLQSGWTQAQLDRIAAGAGDVVVISTANNDAIVQGKQAFFTGQNDAQWRYRNHVGAVAQRFADRCVVVVNAKEDTNPIYNPAQAAILNSNLRDEKARRNNLLIADWALWSHFVPREQFIADQFHFGPDPSTSAGTMPSADAFAGTIEGGIRACAAILRH